MGDRTLIDTVEADRQGSAESDSRQGDIGGADVGVKRTVDPGGIYQAAEYVLCGGTLIRPVRGVEQRMHHVDHSEAGVDGVVHVAAQRLASGDRLGERSFTSVDRSIEDSEYHRPEKGLLVGEVSVQGGDTDTRPLGDCVPGRLTADLEDEFGRGAE